MSTPLVRMTKERKAELALRRETYAKADANVPLIYLARFSGRPHDITIGATTTLSSGEQPRLGAHTRGAGKLVDVTWVKGSHETEMRLHNELDDERHADEREWFVYSERIEAYVSHLLTHPSFATQDHLHAAALEYLRLFPAPSDRVGQYDIFGNVMPDGVLVEDLDDYQTPPFWAEAVRLVGRGQIGCDPSTSKRANDEVIKAQTIFTAENRSSGLHHPWITDELLYCNPPWSQDGIWMRYLEEQIRTGNVSTAIFAVGNTSMDKTWWADSGPYPFAQAIGRPGWRQWTGKIAPPCGGVFYFLGDTEGERRFTRVFSCAAHVYGSRSITRCRGGRALTAREQWDTTAVADFWAHWQDRTRDFTK